MNFLKSIWNAINGIATFVYDITLAPVVALKDLPSQTAGVAAYMIASAASRIIIIASCFFAVPSFLVTLAWAWIVGGFVIGLGLFIFAVIVGVAGLSALAKDIEQPMSSTETEPAAV